MDPLNTGVLIGYVSLMLVIGIWAARGQTSAEDFFLAGRSMPWWAVAMSMFASLTSAVTFMGLPGIAYRGNITLLVVAFVSPLLAPILMWVFYPIYLKYHCTTSYDFIEHRFGEGPRKVVAVLFLLARLGWLGTVVYAPALALSLATGFSMTVSILIIGLLATIYTALGGMRAVIWTDVAQFVILVGGAVWIAVSLLRGVPGGMTEIWSINQAAGHGSLQGGWNPAEMTVGMVFICFFFQMMQDYGTDQVTVQRLLSSKNLSGIRRAIAFNAATDFVMISGLLLIGLGLFAYQQQHPAWLPESLKPDQILPFYILSVLPSGVSGLVIAGIFAAAMSSVDSGINSLSTVVVHDLLGADRREGQDAHVLRLARGYTWGWGLLATGTAFYVGRIEGIIEAFAHFMSLFNAPVLALFLFGIVFAKAPFRCWLPGLAVSLPVTLYVQHASHWSWVYYFPISFGLCFTISVVCALVRLIRSTGSA